ncbi:hypothetical protein VOLCADRAFT_105783 [Volvox carteri f. nagariensis]|uniref:Uncharacterized protein n=1 Tax=Volvox carteri f. nagariensis TaxID=3068 RepID=D8U309_VOLCA|nr:uncharacterized protein VOLCADRAFT_105783 [Volvox carteri f. nagariensis]EFJ45898.1 hypothetical protein VOLCADRAFT_105783 [Volvox carteri f. nagariensis]|eukprot:XP_002952976.1 hypothetical protein VOLCADRAFT_105783 [Volvox carteri f. nagariensis]
MAKRSAEIFANHESVPAGALPFFVPSTKRIRSEGCGAPPSPSDPLNYHYQTLSSSSDEMNDANAADQAEAVSAHHLAAAPCCSYVPWHAGAGFQGIGSMEYLTTLGIKTPPDCLDARRFLEQLAGCLLGCQLASSDRASNTGVVGASLGTALWHSFAELNVLLARQFSELPTSMLRGYHSFTRAPRAQLWFRFAASQGGEMCEEMQAGMPGWLVLMRFLLEHILAPYPTASCVMYTIEVPPWLRTWCARWGQGSNTPLRILALFAYEAAGTPSPRTLYVPCIETAGF